jgi:hypothetical protein
MSLCRSCGAEIVWATTDYGKKMPLDPEPNLRGTVWFDGEHAHVLNRVELKTAQGEHESLWIPHMATCPERKEWRKK